MRGFAAPEDAVSRDLLRRADGAAGAPLALKRLSQEAASLDFLSAQDLNVIASMNAFKYYSNGVRYEFDFEKAVAALINNPLLFWIDRSSEGLSLQLAEKFGA